MLELGMNDEKTYVELSEDREFGQQMNKTFSVCLDNTTQFNSINENTLNSCLNTSAGMDECDFLQLINKSRSYIKYHSSSDCEIEHNASLKRCFGIYIQ